MPEFKNKVEYEKWKADRLKISQITGQLPKDIYRKFSLSTKDMLLLFLFFIVPMLIIYKQPLIVFGIFIICSSIFLIIRLRQHNEKKYEGLQIVFMGKYLIGLPATSSGTTLCNCIITDKAFVFMEIGGGQLGVIPRDAVNQIFIDVKSQLAQRLTVTRMLTLGIFSLAAPKKSSYKEYCLVIDWDDEKGMKNNTVFEFGDSSDNSVANNALSIFKKHIQPKALALMGNEQKCPFCAEIIKKDAKICRYCNRELTSA